MAHSLKPEQILLLPGMRQDLATELAPIGSLAEARNVRFGKTGAIFARRGTSAISSTTHGTQHEIQGSGGLSFLGTAGESAMLGTIDGKIFSRDDTGGIWNYAGRFSTCLPLVRRAGLITEIEGGFAVSKYATAANSAGYILTASSSGDAGSGFTVFVAIDSDDGTRIYSAGAGSGTKCLAVALPSGAFALVTQDGTTLAARYFTIASGVVTVTSGTVGTLNASTQFWDLAAGSSSSWWLIFQDGATQLTIDEFSTASFTKVATRATITVSGNCPCSLWIDTTNSRIWAGWQNDPAGTGAIIARAWSLAGAALCAATTIASDTDWKPPLYGPTVSGGGSVFFLINVFDTTPTARYGTLTLPGVAADPASVTGTLETSYVTAISKPDAMQRAWVITRVNPQPTPSFSTGDTSTLRALLLRWDALNLDGATVELSCDAFDTDNQAGWPTTDMFASISNASGLCTFAVPRRLRNGGAFDGLYGLEVYRYESVELHPWRSTVQMGMTLAIAGQPTECPGNSAGESSGTTFMMGAAEIGMATAPQITSVTEGTTGNLTLEGTYSYTDVIEWIDMFGRRHRSQPSPPIEITLTGANDDVTVTLASPNYGQRVESSMNSLPVHHLYRTEAGGEVHWRVTPGSGAPVASGGTTTYVDTVSDENLLRYGEALYVDQALCDYNLAPSCRFMWRDERRVYFGGLWDNDQIHASLDMIPVQPIESSDFAGLNGPAFRVLVGEPVTGGEYQDGVNYVFGRRAIYAFSGDGPDRQGAGSFSRPRVLTKETGCKDYRSVRATSRGIFFQSDRGIELLPRGGGNPQFIGAGIQDLVASYPNCMGTAIHSDASSRTVRFLLQNDAGNSSIVAVFDLDIGAWSYDTVSLMDVIGEWPSGTIYGRADQSGATMGLLEAKSGALHTDEGNPITMVVTTHVIRPWGVSGYGRFSSVQALFSNPGGADSLDVTATLDGSTTVPSSPAPWTLSSAAGFDYRELTVSKECTAYTLSTSYTRAGSDRLPALHGYMTEMAPLQGARRLPATSQ